MAVQDLPIVLYTYETSPYGRRLVWYLNLRKIPYKTCSQSPVLPRPDLALLGLNYRRIPLLTIGRDIYLDTRLIIAKLETLYPPSPQHPSLSPSTPEQAAISTLISHHTIDFPGARFWRAAQLMPSDSPAMKDPRFIADRNQMMTGNPDAKAFHPDSMAAKRPEALVEIRRFFELLETTLLADGRDWVFKDTQGPSLGDIEAVYIPHWLKSQKGALDADVIGKDQYPRVFAWIERFDQAVKKARVDLDSIKGDVAAKLILGAEYAEGTGTGVLSRDPIIKAGGFKEGDVVTFWPMDQAPVNKDTGRLVAWDQNEVVVEIEAKDSRAKPRVHAPRHGFKVVKGQAAKI